MDNVLPIRSIKDEAGDWLARLQAEDASDDDRRAFVQWQAADGRHREAFQDVEATAQRIEALLNRAPRPEVERQGRRKPLLLAVAAAALVAVAVGVLLFRQTQNQGAYSTAVGEVRSIALPDGSSMQLNTDSLAEVDYQTSRRVIRLKRGEGLFTVTHNAARPFIVQAGGGAVRAVGTAFSVRLDRGNAVQVLVTQGRVEVTSEARKVAMVSGGEGVQYGRSLSTVHEVKPAEIGRSLAWRDGMLSFEGDDLAYVVGEVGRYTRTQLVIADPEIRGISVYGYFKANDLEAFLRRLEANFPIEVHREGGAVRLTQRDSSIR